MKREVMYTLLIVIMIFCFNSTNVYAQDTSIASENTEVKEVAIDSTINNIDSNSLNKPSDIPNEEKNESVEENSSLNDSTNIIDEENTQNVEENGEQTNNEELLTLEELNKIDDKLEFTEDILTVKGNLFDYTNTTFIRNLIFKEEIINKYNLIIEIIDKNNNIITDEVIINDEFYLIIKNETKEMKFKITFLFDFDENYIVNEDDKVKLLEFIAEDSTIIESESLSYFDYVLKNKTYDVPERGDISLDMEITADKDHYDYGNEFDVVITNSQPPLEVIEEDKDNLPVEDQPENNILETEKDQISNNNPEKDQKIYMNIISGKIDYNHNALKLLSITFNDYENLSTEEDSYLFWVDNLETIRIVLRFKVINQNSREYITIYESDICSEGKKIETEPIRTKVILNEIPKPAPPKEENKVYYVPQSEEKVIIREKNTDSSASNINIKGHLVKFNYLIKNYIVKADYSETSLDFDITLTDKEYATYKITGNSNFKVGENPVIVTVIAEDGSTTDYKFNVIRFAKNVIHDKKTNNFGYDLLSMNIFLGALIAAIGIIYKIFSYRLNKY